MATEATSALTFRDLLIEVSRFIGLAYYGSDGTGVAQVPVDAHDLDECKRHVNNGIRMFVHDAPQPNGWRWTRPTASVTIWGTISAMTGKTLVSSGYMPAEGSTLLTANQDSFYETMEEKPIVVTGAGTFTVSEYVSATQIRVYGDASAIGVAGSTFSFTADGNYTLPATFGGQYMGQITYTAETNQGISLDWVDESRIRQWREDITDETGDPYWAAVRPMTSQSTRRRWELMFYPKPDEIMVVEFPYILHFDRLVNLSEVSPAPIGHDETIRAACLAVCERDVENAMGGQTAYYRQVCLPNSHRVDALSAPKKLGYAGNPGKFSGNAIEVFRNSLYERPTVTVNT